MLRTRSQSLERLLNSFLVACILVSAFSLTAIADGEIVATTVEEAQADEDYVLLGEYVGPVELTAERTYQRVGLQVRAIGDGNYEALQSLGGLPGEAEYDADVVSLFGKRLGEYLILSGGPYAVIVHSDHCIVIDEKGDRIGRLERVMRESPTMGAPAPAEATVLFDGTNVDQFATGQMTEDGLLMQGAEVKPMFQDFNMHVEFRLPHKPLGREQDRCNSGFYLQRRYELQVLDSFATTPVFNGCGALYRYQTPDLNMCLPPLQWQTYDVIFTAPRWASDGTKTRNARITVWHNGVKIQDDLELKNKTGAGQPEGSDLLPILIQDHGNPIRFRNFWIVDRGLTPIVDFPVYPEVEEEAPAPVEPQTIEPEEDSNASQDQE
jgi:hypothetical protein